MVEENKIENVEGEELEENEFYIYWSNPKKGEKVKIKVCVDEEVLEYARKHYSNPLEYIKKELYEYLKTIEEKEIDWNKNKIIMLCLEKKNIEWVEKHYGSLSNFIEKIYQDYVRAINELK